MRTCAGDGSSPVGQWNGTAPVCISKQMTCIFLHVCSPLGSYQYQGWR